MYMYMHVWDDTINARADDTDSARAVIRMGVLVEGTYSLRERKSLGAWAGSSGRVGGVERTYSLRERKSLGAWAWSSGRVGGVERTYSLRERKSLGAWAGSSGRVKSLLPPPYVSISGEFSSRSTDI